MKQLDVGEVENEVARLCILANYELGDDIFNALKTARKVEKSPTAIRMLDYIIENARIAQEDKVPICQDTGMVVVFLEIGQDLWLTGGDLYTAINQGVRRGYKEGYLRNSVVRNPLMRGNTNDNTPAIIYPEIVPGDCLKLTVAPKGFGSENMSAVKMLAPAEGLEGVRKFVIETVFEAGPNPCPPVIVGVGIGGTMDKAALLAKKALTRPIDCPNSIEHIAELEKDLLEHINELGIGAQGFGGTVTALGVNIEVFPTHIAGLPVAVNIGCHVTRHKTSILEGK
jgi:fumarate hydratase subunit alpha